MLHGAAKGSNSVQDTFAYQPRLQHIYLLDIRFCSIRLCPIRLCFIIPVWHHRQHRSSPKTSRVVRISQLVCDLVFHHMTCITWKRPRGNLVGPDLMQHCV